MLERVNFCVALLLGAVTPTSTLQLHAPVSGRPLAPPRAARVANSLSVREGRVWDSDVNSAAELASMMADMQDGGGDGGSGGEREQSKSRGRLAVISRPKPKPKSENREQVDKDNSWRVLLHNDDVHTFDYVSMAIVKVIQTVTRKKAHKITVQCHSMGTATVTTTWKQMAKQCAAARVTPARPRATARPRLSPPAPAAVVGAAALAARCADDPLPQVLPEAAEVWAHLVHRPRLK